MAFISTTGNSAQAWRPDLYTFAAETVLGDSLIMSTSTVAGAIEGDAPTVRVAYITDDDADFYTEGTEFDDAEPSLSEALIQTSKIGQLVTLSREQYGQAGTAERISQSVARALQRKADNAYIAQTAPGGPAVTPAAGLHNVAGIVGGDPITDNLDPLVELIAELQSNGANPTHLILDPLAWAAARTLKTATGSNQSLVGAGVEDAAQRLMGLPVIVNGEAPANSLLVVDQAAVVSAVGPITVATSMDAAFARDSVVVRATWRTGHVVPRPDRIGKLTVGDLGS